MSNFRRSKHDGVTLRTRPQETDGADEDGKKKTEMDLSKITSTA